MDTDGSQIPGVRLKTCEAVRIEEPMNLIPKFKVTLIKKGRSHFYEVDTGYSPIEVYPGVTGTLSVINKPALIPWATKQALECARRALELKVGSEAIITTQWIAEVILEASKRPDKIKDDAADLGTRVHAHCDAIIAGKRPLILEDEMPGVLAFAEFCKKTGIKWLLGDTKVASRVNKFGGSLDAVGEIGGDIILADFKTSNGTYAEYALQVGAYFAALSETYGIVADKALIARFGKTDGKFEVKYISDLPGAFNAFLKARDLKNFLEGDVFESCESGANAPAVPAALTNGTAL